jgi:hypothetical protein
MYFDDLSWKGLFSPASIERALSAEIFFRSVENAQLEKVVWRPKVRIYARRVVSFAIFVILTRLSIPVINNLLSPQQAMNTSFDAFRIVNTYGAFGSVTKIRTEVILEGTSESAIGPDTDWKEFQFKCKPG